MCRVLAGQDTAVLGRIGKVRATVHALVWDLLARRPDGFRSEPLGFVARLAD